MQSYLKIIAFFNLILITVFSFGQTSFNISRTLHKSSECNPVINLSATVEDTTTVHLSWIAPEGSFSFSIFRDGDSLTTQNEVSFVEENLSYGSHYYCVVTNYDTCISDPACITVNISPTSCNPPNNLTATIDDNNGSDPIFVLSWESTDNMQSYNIYMDGQLLAIGVIDTFFIVNGGLAGVEYCFNVSSQCEYLESELSNTACATIPAADECMPPSLFIAALSYAEMHINLAWITNYYANSYNIYRNEVFLVNVMGDSYVDTDIEFGETYCYTITTVCENGESEATEPECIEDVSIEEYAKGFILFPNPAKESFFIESDAIINNVQIYNMIGQLVYDTNHSENNAQIDASNWKSGIYLVKITTNAATITKKLIIQ